MGAAAAGRVGDGRCSSEWLFDDAAATIAFRPPIHGRIAGVPGGPYWARWPRAPRGWVGGWARVAFSFKQRCDDDASYYQLQRGAVAKPPKWPCSTHAALRCSSFYCRRYRYR